jgi:4-hydroxy-tetrahydrodipicolinate synthase
MRLTGKNDLTGVFTALVTPFDADDGGLDATALRLLIRRQIDAGGIAGLAVVAGSGEHVNLSPEEREEVVRITVEEARRDLIVIAGVLSPGTRDAVNWSVRASRLGADALLVLTPFYNGPSSDGVVRHFTAISYAVDTPIILYNNPSRTTISLTMDEYGALSEKKNIVGVKECHRDLSVISSLVRRLGSRWSILSGEDDLLFPSLVLGADGGIITTSNILPRLWCDLFQAIRRNDIAGARDIHHMLSPIVSAVYTKNHPALIKAALDSLGLPGGPVRLPLISPDPAHKAGLAQLLSAVSGA